MLSIVLLVSACSNNGGGPSNGKGSNVNQPDTGQGSPKSDEGEQKTVVLSVMMKDRFLDDAVRKFEEKHKNIHIEVKEYKAAPDAGDGMSMPAISLGDVEKYVQSVTTEVISGKGSDLILMSELPQDKFVSKNLLINLNELLSKDSSIDQSSLYTNILKASQDGNGLYSMPISFSMEVFQGNKDVLKQANVSIDPNQSWSWSEFIEIAKKLKQQGAEKLINFDPTSLLFDFMEDNYTELVKDGQPNFDSDLFRNLLQSIKSMYDEGLLSDGMSFDNSKTAFQMVGIYGSEQALTMANELEFYNKPGSNASKNGVSFRPSFSLGINSKSKVQAEAWEFIKFLLSDEMQSTPNLLGLPMNKAIAETRFKDILQKIETGTLETMMPKDRLPDGETVKKRIETVEKLMAETEYRRSSDMKVLTIAMEEFNSFMSGQKSVEDVSKLIQNRVKTYLNE